MSTISQTYNNPFGFSCYAMIMLYQLRQLMNFLDGKVRSFIHLVRIIKVYDVVAILSNTSKIPRKRSLALIKTS